MGVIGGAVVGVAFGLRPTPARASHCTYVTCQSKSNPNAHGCCLENTTCCYGPDGEATDCCYPEQTCDGSTGKCKDPQCFAPATACGPVLCCVPGETCCGGTQCCLEGEECVGGVCRAKCPPGASRCGSKCCPKPDRGRVVCGQNNARCCVESPPPVFCTACSNSATKARAAASQLGPTYFCGAFEKTCAERSDREYHGDLGNCVRVLRADPTAPPRASNAYYFHPCFLDTRMAHTKRLMRCDRVPDHTVCEGGECQADSLTCCHYSGGRSATQRSARAAAVVRALDKLEDFDEPVASSAGRVSRAELRRRIRLAEPRLAKTRRRLFAAQELPLTDAAQRKEIVAACNAHRRELLRLRRSVAAGRGGRPQRLLIKSYDTTARALLIYRDALAISNSPKSLPILAEAGEVGARANRYAAQALRALKL